MSALSKSNKDYAARSFPGLREFESGTLDPEAFDHEAHVYIAWRLLGEDSFAAATQRFTHALKRLTRALGIEGKYHETITWFFMALIAERQAGHPEAGWGAFYRDNRDLVSEPGRLLARYYSPGRLGSDLAKRQFLLPDRAGAEPSVSQ